MDPSVEFKAFLGDVERVLVGSLEDPHGRGETLIGAARHLCLGGGGKRARPLLVKIFGTLCGAPGTELVDIAVAAELIHSASLLHDDVVDKGMFRRGRPTVNAQWGNLVAVMTGDMLLATALGRLARLDRRITERAIATVAEMTRAAMAEVEARGNLDLPLENLRQIGEGKTGALFGWCGAAATFITDDEEAGRRFDAFGRRLGVAFQIADDVRDLTGVEVGKPQYADLQARNLSTPILLAAQGHPSIHRRLKDAWSYSAMTVDRVQELGAMVLCSGAVEQSMELMEQELSAAVDALGHYALTPTGKELVTMTQQLARGIALRGSA